ncbi:MAG: hypothetical protein PHF63_13605 [Herbinix sp.]|nr:hypothetical protein [Herbinix sp.]
MKKLAFSTIILMLILAVAGCSGKEKYLKADDVTVSTMLAKANGKIQVATVEDFDKAYYNVKELQDFIDGQVASYNKKAGAEKITVNSVDGINKKAVMLLTYSGMDQYAAFNDVTAAYFNGGVVDNPLTLPTTLVNAKDETLASTEEVLQNEKYKILVLTEPYNIVVDGKVKFYSENATLIDENEVKGGAEGMTIVVFKH